MPKTLTRTAAVSALTLAVGLAGLAAAPTDAEARWRHHHDHDNHLAAAGIGLLTGAIIAGATRDRYYGGGYYGGYTPYSYGGYGSYYAPRVRYRYAPAPRVYEPRIYYDAPTVYRSYGRDENYYGGYDCSARWNAYDTGSSSTNVGVGGDHCR